MTPASEDQGPLAILQVTPPWEWPEGAADSFRTVLTDPQAGESDRLIAAELAGDLVVMNDDLAKLLVEIANNAGNPDRLRTQAAISLGPVLDQADTLGFDDPGDVPIAESTFHHIQDSLRHIYLDEGTPTEVKRRILEASVRAPQDWHTAAVREAWSSGNRKWILTAVFSMRWVRGFDDQILEALQSADRQIQAEAVQAAGNSGIDAAWPVVVKLVEDPATPKDLLLAAIEAVGNIRPGEAIEVLSDLADSDDEEIAEAADEAIMMAEAAEEFEEEEEDEEDSDNSVN
jgi:hypothetical protein